MRDIPWVPEVGHLPGAVANPLFAERLPVLLSLRSVYEIHHDVAECCQKKRRSETRGRNGLPPAPMGLFGRTAKKLSMPVPHESWHSQKG